MSDTGLTVPNMTEPPRCYDVTITVDRDGSHHLNPTRLSSLWRTSGWHQPGRPVSLVRTLPGQIISVVTALSRRPARGRGYRPGRRVEALRCPVPPPIR